MIIFILINIIGKVKNKKEIEGIYTKPLELMVISNAIICLFFWFCSAPLVRYGMVYLLVPIALVVYIVRACLGRYRFNKTVMITMVIIGCAFYLYKDANFRLVEPQGYWRMDNPKRNWYGWEVYVHEDADSAPLTDYVDFPGIHQESVLEEILPRGDTLKDGFRPMQKD